MIVHYGKDESMFEGVLRVDGSNQIQMNPLEWLRNTLGCLFELLLGYFNQHARFAFKVCLLCIGVGVVE